MIRLALLSFTVVIATAVAHPARISAQQSDTSGSEIVRRARLRPGVMTRMVAPGVGRVQGRYVSLDGRHILLDGPPEVRVVAREIDSLWVRDVDWKRGARTGALIGASALVATELLGDLALGAPLEVTDYFLTGTVGAGMGALAGIGVRVLFFSRWRARHPGRASE
jgi:hypothetical protein